MILRLPLQGSGLIVNVCSVSSYVDLPLSAAYNASKSALLSVTNVLRMEVEPLGLHVMGDLPSPFYFSASIYIWHPL